MKQEIKNNTLPDFKTVKYTAVISDLHLCEAEKVNPKYPLWKKFKTKDFFFDEVFKDFLNKIQEMSAGETVELILNGDIFDFDSVMSTPRYPLFSISWVEKKCGLFPREERSKYKIDVILKDHLAFVAALQKFIAAGNRVVFVTGNHDLELHFPAVQESILNALDLPSQFKNNVRFVEWFYISNGDTLIEHGNQYDPYCVCEDPLLPFVRGYNYIAIKLPFGNQACRYITNAMGFFNPHVDTNYIMSLKQYANVFLRYMVRAQPLIVFTWFVGSIQTIWFTFKDRLASPIRNPYKVEDKTEDAALKANASPRMVRELKELFAEPASSHPFLLLQELWLDRAFIVMLVSFIIFEVFSLIRSMLSISYWWAVIPFFLFMPFFLFYSKSITSLVSGYKEPDDRILAMASSITHVQRIIFGHTHIVRHEMIGFVEHLNSGCWSPAFLDVECTKPIDQKTFVWLSPIGKDNEESSVGSRKAELFRFVDGEVTPVYSATARLRQKI